MQTRPGPRLAALSEAEDVALDSHLLALGNAIKRMRLAIASATIVRQFTIPESSVFGKFSRQRDALMSDHLERFFCTEPADRQKAEDVIRKYHHLKDLPPPQFIWCKSPQTAIVLIKIVCDLHESTRPIRPEKIKGGDRTNHRREYRPWRSDPARISSSFRFQNVSSFRGLPHIPPVTRGPGFFVEQGLEVILDQARMSMIMTPDTTFYSEEGGNGKQEDLIERSLANTEPHLSGIKLDPHFFGRRLELKETWFGQHKTVLSGEKYDETQISLSKLCGWVWDYGTHVFMCERTCHVEYVRDNRGVRLHNLNGPAMSWLDGLSVYAINGVKVPDFVVIKPKLITTYKINQEVNQEVRRIMIDRYKFGESISGAAAYVRDSRARRIDHDKRWGTLWRLPQPRDEDIVMLEVVNRSPEPDGSFKRYYLRVPPDTVTSHAAVAWTFGFSGWEFGNYNPLQET